MKTVAEYTKAVGLTPDQDDLDRANCTLAGSVDHWHCGWCDKCNKPRFLCQGHTKPKRIPS